MTTKAKIKAIRGRMSKSVPAPELGEGESITVRRPNAGERRDMMRLFYKDGEMKPDVEFDLQLWVVKTFCVDDDGNPLFDGEDNIEELLDFSLVDRISDAFRDLTKADSASLDALEKN